MRFAQVCAQLFQPRSPEERQHAEETVTAFTDQLENLVACQVLLAQTQHPYVVVVAANALRKHLIYHLQAISVEKRLELRALHTAGLRGDACYVPIWEN